MLTHQFDLGRGRSKVNIAGQRGRGSTISVADNGGQLGQVAVQCDAAPGADGIGAAGGHASAVERQRIYRLAINAEFDLLTRTVADDDTDGWCPRVMVKRRKQEFGRTVAQRQPIGFRAGGRTVSGIVVGGGNILGLGSCQAGGRDGGREVHHYQLPAACSDKARRGLACRPRVAGAVDKGSALRQGHALGLDDVGARHNAIEVIAAVRVRNRKAAVFEHYPHPGDAQSVILDRAVASGDPTDDRGPAGNGLTLDPHRCAGESPVATNVDGLGAVDGLTCGRVTTDRHGIGNDRTGTGCQIADGNCHA